MKKYICLNRVECSWADEKPPREFALPEDDENACPNCNSANIREAKAVSTPVPKSKRLGVIAVLLAGLIGLLWYSYNPPKGPDSPPGPSVVPQDPTPPRPNEPQKPGGGKPIKSKPVAYKPLPETVTVIKGSEGCDVCVHYYSVNDNAGRVREVREENSTECCPCGDTIQIEGRNYLMDCSVAPKLKLVE